MKIHIQCFVTTFSNAKKDRQQIVEALIARQRKAILYTIENSSLAVGECMQIRSIYLGEKEGHRNVLLASLDKEGDVVLLIDYFHIEGRSLHES